MNTRTFLQLLSFALIGTASAGEIWIAQSASGSTPGGSGTVTSPYTVPVGDSTTFDSLINLQAPANTTIHVGAGTFLLQRASSSSELRAGCSLFGSGIGITTIKLANGSLTSPRSVIQMAASGVSSNASGTVRDLTVDCNSANQTCSYMNGVTYQGAFALIENVEIINFGTISGEGFGIFGGNFDSADVAKASHVIIRNCRVVKPWTGSAGGITAIHPSGNNAWSGVVEGCYVDLSTSTLVRNAGLSFAGSPQALVIAHNTAIGIYRGVHVDTPGTYSPKAARGVIIAHNRIYDCDVGIGIGGEDDTPYRTDHMEKFLIEGNSIEMLRAGTGIQLWGGTTAFQVKNNTISKNVNAPASTYRVGIFVSGGAQSHVLIGNRFDFSGDSYFTMIYPYTSDPDTTASQNNRFEDNTFTSEVLVPKSFVSFRKASNPTTLPLPPGSSTWEFTLGGAQGDNNPTTQLVSHGAYGSNYYTYMRMSPLPGNSYVGAARTWFDPDGSSGVYVGSQFSGVLGAGGWIWSNTGIGMPAGSRLVMIEGGTKPSMGTVTLASGTATVSTTAARSSSRIFLTQQQDGGTPGAVRVSSRSTGAFTITSTSATDASSVAWLIIDSNY